MLRKQPKVLCLKVGCRERVLIFIAVWSREAPGVRRDISFFFLLSKFFSTDVRDFWGGVNECRLRWGWK